MRRARGRWAAHRRLDLVVPSLLAAGVIGFTMLNSGRGLDLMDESYVLRLVAHPDASRPAGEPYLFAFLVHPLYELCGADVAWFRALGTLLVVGVAGVTALQVMRSTGTVVPHVVALSVVMATMASSTLVFLLEVRVLSYRSMGLVGLLVVVTGVARCLRGLVVSGGLLVGAGGWVTFAARPTSAAGAALLVVGLLVTRRLAGRSAPWAALGVAVGATVTLIAAEMDPVQAVRYLTGGVHLDALLGGHPDMGVILGLGTPHPGALVVAGLPLVGAGIAVLFARTRVRVEALPTVDFWGSVAVVAVGGALTPTLVLLTSRSTSGFKVLALVCLVPLVGLYGLATSRHDPARPQLSSLLLVLGLTPYLFSLGSNRDVLTTTAQASATWVLFVGVAFVAREPRVRLLPGSAPLGPALAIVAVVMTMATVVVYEDGADGPELSRATVPTRVAGGTLALRPETAHIVRQLDAVASEHGLGDTPVVDLSGLGAGYAYALGGPPLGRAHMYATFEGHVASAHWALAQASCADRERAWLIVAANLDHGLEEAWSSEWGTTRQHYEQVLRFSDVRYRKKVEFHVLRPRGGHADLRCSDPEATVEN